MTDNHDALDRYLDDLPNGQPPSGESLDLGLIETIHHLSELGRNPSPRPDFVDHLEERLMSAVSNVTVLPSPPVRIGRSGESAIVPIGSARPKRDNPRWLPVLVSAALILASLGVAWRAFDPAGPRDSPQFGAPAIQAPATPSPEATGGSTLFAVTLPPDVVPMGEEVNVLLARDTIPANSVTTHAPMDCCPGSKVYYILAGSVSFASDGSAQRIRPGTGGTLEEITAGTTVDLTSGDTLVVRNEHYQTWTSGEEPVDILTTAVASGFWMTSFDPVEWVGNGTASNSQTIPLPAGSYLLRVRRIEVSADTTFPPAARTILQLGLTSAGAGAGQASDQTLSVAGVRGSLAVFVLSLETAPGDAGTPVPGVSSVQPHATPSP